MGCSSSKDARTLESLPKSKISSSVEIKCKICYSNYDRDNNEPMVIPCGHTLCRNCLTNMPKTQCPYDRVKFDKSKCQKNYQILEILESQDLQQKKNSEFFTEKIVCNKKHKTTWCGIEELCSICQSNGPGFKCKKCSYNRCIKCFKRKPTKMCYNGHKTKWNGNKMRCVKCRNNSVGWQCSQCIYCFCHECSKTQIEKDYCPNGHNIVWNPTFSCKQNCLQCGDLGYGFACEPCKFVICKKCLKYQFANTQCPNLHLTTWLNAPSGKQGKLKCQSCNKQSNGFSCEICMFLICTECCKWKFSYNDHGSSFCPNNHQASWKLNIKNCIKCKNGEIDGFVCKDDRCDFQLCRSCSKLRPVTRTCFNKHTSIWKKQKSKCLSCSQTDSGWYCQQCNYFFCSQCTSTTLNGNLCPNFHRKVWTKIQKQCEICNQLNHGWECSKCEIFTCSLCQKTDLSKDCPNKHQLLISQQYIKCLICETSKTGWNCKQCSYQCCFDCLKGKINNVSCPFYHLLHNIDHQEGLKCQRCQSTHQKYRSCQNKCLILCQKCTIKK